MFRYTTAGFFGYPYPFLGKRRNQGFALIQSGGSSPRAKKNGTEEEGDDDDAAAWTRNESVSVGIIIFDLNK